MMQPHSRCFQRNKEGRGKPSLRHTAAVRQIWCYIRGIIGVLLVILAIDLVVQGVKALSAQKKAAAAK